MNIFSTDHHSQLKAAVEQVYHDFIEDLCIDLAEGFSSDFLSKNFLPRFTTLLKKDEAKHYEPLKTTWITIIESLITIIQLHEELRDEEDDDEKVLIEEEIFDFWNAHDFSLTFVDLVENEGDILEVSKTLISLLENQVLSFFAVHFQESFASDSPVLYSISKELGDHDDRLYLGGHRFIARFNTQEHEGLLPLSRVDRHHLICEIQTDDDVYVKAIEPLPSDHLVELSNGHQLKVIIRDSQLDSQLEEFKKRISVALALISKCSPDCFNSFCSFTHTIIPIAEQGIVSYSLQSIPGVSLINMVERDFVDLMDDLIHENGHHYLNAFLNHEELLNEDDEQVFYSPWRRALRPVRGLYHATLTFFWAAKLFYDLSNHTDALSELSQEDINKVKKRFLEEMTMLHFCLPQMDNAIQSGKITKLGQELYLSFKRELSILAKEELSFEKDLEKNSPDHFHELVELRRILEEKRKEFELF